MEKKKVLFICVHNSARSQMAEAFLNERAGERFDAESAGFEPGILNPLAVEVMQEVGVDISKKKTKCVFDFYRQGKRYDYVIAVCDESQSQKCPVFPGASATTRLHWSFDDPASFQGGRDERLRKTRQVRDQIREKVEEWIKGFS